MSRESILKIQETEREADEIVAKARAKAQQMLEAAEKEGRELCRSTEESTNAEVYAMLQELRKRTADLSARMENESTAEAKEIMQSVSLRRKIAEKIIIRGVEAKCR